MARTFKHDEIEQIKKIAQDVTEKMIKEAKQVKKLDKKEKELI